MCVCVILHHRKMETFALNYCRLKKLLTSESSCGEGRSVSARGNVVAVAVGEREDKRGARRAQIMSIFDIS
jgi:uncharacterized protein YqiB (DUF1249 family)